MKREPDLRVDGVKFFAFRCDRGDGLKSEDGQITITPAEGNRRVPLTYRARYCASNGVFWRDIYSKRTGRVRTFNFTTSAARVAIRMLKQDRAQ